jgi:hypothetical protein
MMSQDYRDAPLAWNYREKARYARYMAALTEAWLEIAKSYDKLAAMAAGFEREKRYPDE